MTASFENAEKMTGDHIDVSDLMLLGAGRTAEVYALDEKRALKLYHRQIPRDGNSGLKSTPSHPFRHAVSEFQAHRHGEKNTLSRRREQLTSWIHEKEGRPGGIYGCPDPQGR